MLHDKLKELKEKKFAIVSLTGMAYLWALFELKELELEIAKLQAMV